ncbi:MAG: hypothetical protein KDE27_07015 [Planctomycetes bacterium]|nr:hypothetical protein [Planctomycetota bacterium]
MCSFGVATTFAAAIPVAAPVAQEWRLPELGAAEYRRSATARASAAAERARAAAAAEPSERAAERFAPVVAPAPWVTAGELAPDRRRLEEPVRDLRDVLRAIACDLTGSGGRFEAVVPFGDISVAGSWRRETGGGERFRGTVRCKPPRDERLRAFCVRDCDGTLELARSYDDELGVVRTFAGTFDLVVEEAEKAHRRLVVADDWQLVALRHNQDAGFRRAVQTAIDRGAAFVRAAVAGDKDYLGGRVADDRSYGSGRLALGLLTLLAAHVPCDDEVVKAGFAELLRRRVVDTYSLAAALMALGKLAVVPGRALSAREQKCAGQWLERLLDNVDPRTEDRELLRFNYVRGPRYDTSVQQYGLLGLAAARQCGLTVDGAKFAAAGRQLLAVQCARAPGGRRAHRIVTQTALRAAAGDPVTGREVHSPGRGFAYVDADEPPFGSMTAAGISGLLLARDGMAGTGHTDRSLERQLERAIDEGFAWLARELSFRCNPGFPERSRFHWYYWLYCLERSCQLADIAHLGDRDWYYEGALQLLAQQQKNGGFRAGGAADLQIDATCFAILFLARATGRAAVTRSGG